MSIFACLLQPISCWPAHSNPPRLLSAQQFFSEERLQKTKSSELESDVVFDQICSIYQVNMNPKSITLPGGVVFQINVRHTTFTGFLLEARTLV